MARRGVSVGVEITGSAKGYKASMEDAQRATAKMKRKVDTHSKGIIKSFKTVGYAIAAVFAVDRIVNFTKEAVKLAASAEGIKAAFISLNKVDLLSSLQKATRGTVDNVKLMQKAVQARNFKIPLDQLATYFEFATKRAIQTGESVDYLVDSIITGIGRKSVLVMDNLGISAVELQKEVGKVGDFGKAAGNIIRRELTSMGDVTSTASTRFASFSASVSNLKTAWGEFLNNSELIKNSIEGIASALQDIADRGLLNALFESKGKTVSRAKEKALWDVTWNGLPIKLKEAEPSLNNINTLTTEAGKSIGEYVEKIKAGATEATKMAEAWKIIKSEILGAKGGLAKLKITTPYIGTGVPALAGLAPAPAPVDELIIATLAAQAFNDKLQNELSIVNALDSAFVGFFQNMGSGIDAMVKSFIGAINQIAAQLAANAAIFGLLSILFPGSAIVKGGIGPFLKGVFGLAEGGLAYGPTLAAVGEYSGAKTNPEVVAPLSKLKGLTGGTVKFEFKDAKLKGTDIYFSVIRTTEMLNANT